MALVLTEVLSGPINVIPIKSSQMFGDRMIVTYLDVAFDSSYVTGGEAFDISKYIPDTAGIILAVLVPEDTQGYVIKYIQDTNRTASGGKLKAYYADYDAVADGALIEVANGVDLSALTAVRVEIKGII